MAHIITAVVRAGVLSLAWSVAQLGWIAGPVSLLSFEIITYISAFIQADCHRLPDPVTGKRNYSYTDAVRIYLGKKRMLACSLLQHMSLYGTSIAYVITASTSISSAIWKSNCYHEKGRHRPCHFGSLSYMLFFGGVQIVMLLIIPDFQNMSGVLVVAAIMSFTYSFIGLGLGLAKVLENGRVKGGILGEPATNVQKKLWNSFEALVDIAFAYPYSRVLLEDTLKSPPSENKTVKQASMVSILLITFLYFGCGCFGYAAFGDETPGNLLTGFGFFKPCWLIDLANACIVLHLIGGYQVYSQPIFAMLDRWIVEKFPHKRFVNGFRLIKVPVLPALRMNLMKVILRTTYVMSTTGIALLFPYFNSVLGVLGALNFWPLAIYFPVEMYIMQKITPWSRTWVVLQLFSFVCFEVTVLGFLGSFQCLIRSKFS